MVYKAAIYILFFITILAGCVSVQISQPTIEKAKNVQYSSPGKPFKLTHSPTADEIWISTKTANTISYFSSCSADEPPLKNISTTALQGIEDIQIVKEVEITMNDREALNSTIEGKLEGVPVKLQIYVFKKNACSFQITYVSLKENFEKEVDHFNNFIKSFRVP